MNVGSLANKILKYTGYEVKKKGALLASDFEKEFIEVYKQCKPYTMTSPERMYGLYKSVQYIISNKVAGDFVECGVWKGGSSMVIAKTLIQGGDTNRKIYLYDTFEGMPTASALDYTIDGVSGEEDAMKQPCYAPYDEVIKNMSITGFSLEKLELVKGKVEDTIPRVIPEKIALLRLDTDWYESTMHELIHLYPRLVKNGVLIIDDYGHWKGAREAVDQFFKDQNIKPLLNRLDYTGRLMIKTE